MRPTVSINRPNRRAQQPTRTQHNSKQHAYPPSQLANKSTSPQATTPSSQSNPQGISYQVELCPHPTLLHSIATNTSQCMGKWSLIPIEMKTHICNMQTCNNSRGGWADSRSRVPTHMQSIIYDIIHKVVCKQTWIAIVRQHFQCYSTSCGHKLPY